MIVTEHTCLLDCGWGCVNETENKVTSKFKAGDRVRLTGSEWAEFDFRSKDVVTIQGIDPENGPYFDSENEGGPLYISDDPYYGAELVTDHQGEYVVPGLSVGVTGVDPEPLPEGESVANDWNELADEYNFRNSVENITGGIASMLIAKNKAYGNSALDPIRTFSKANAREQLLVRIDDKLSRIARGHDFPNEDTIDDLIGYLVLLKIAGNDDD